MCLGRHRLISYQNQYQVKKSVPVLHRPATKPATETGSKLEGFNNKQTDIFQAKMEKLSVEIIDIIVVERIDMNQRGSEQFCVLE